MSETILVQTQIDAAVAQRATAVLEASGLTLSDAVRLLLTLTADEGAFPPASMADDIGAFVDEVRAANGSQPFISVPADSHSHDVWFRAKVQQALDDPRPAIPGEEVEQEFALLRSALEAGITAQENSL